MRTHSFLRWLSCSLLAVSASCGIARATDIVTCYEYNKAGQVTKQYVEVGEGGDTQRLSERRTDYDVLGRACRVTELATPGTPDSTKDRISETAWDVAGNVVLEQRKCDTGDACTLYQYDDLNRRTVMVDPAGGATTYFSDNRGNVVQADQWLDATHSLTSVYSYDAAGKQTGEGHYEGDAPSLWIDRLYDGRGNKIQELQCAWTQQTPSGGGQPQNTLSPLTQQRWYYDGFGRLALQVQMADPTSSAAPAPLVDRLTLYAYAYDTKQITATIAGAGNSATARTTQYAYDCFGRPTTITDPMGNTQDLTYVPVGAAGEGQVASKNITDGLQWDPAGQVNHQGDLGDEIIHQLFAYEYDALGRRTRQTAYGSDSVARRITNYEYDGLDRCTQVTNPNGIITQYTFNTFGEQTTVTEDLTAGSHTGLGRSTDSVYDQLGRLVAQTTTDGDGHTETTTYAYDLAGRRTGITFPDNGGYTYAYDAAGHMVSRTDPRNQQTIYTNNWRGQPLTKTVAGTLKETFTYYPTGWMQSAAVSNTNKSEFTCDAFGQTVAVTQTIDGVAKTLDYQFCPSGDRKQLSYPSDIQVSASRLALTYTYDRLGQVVGIDRNSQTLTSYTYAGRNLLSRDIRTTSAAETHVRYEVAYNVHRQQSRLKNTALVGTTATLLDGYGYTYDANGNRQTVAVSGDARLGANTAYGYDALDRLTNADYASNQAELFNYDLLGNRTTYSDRQARSTAYTHNSVNEYTSISSGTQAPVHDLAGNLTATENGYQLAYDFENRLIAVHDRNSTHTLLASYTYDALGHRVAQDKGDVHTRYYYDGDTVLAEYNGTNTLQRYHIHGPTYVDEHILLSQGGQEYYYLLTSLYSVSGLADASGNVVERYRYDAYGQPSYLPPPLIARNFLKFQAAFSGPLPCTEAGRSWDLNGDGKVDLVDYQLWAAGSGGSGGLSPFRFTGQRLDFQLTDGTTSQPTLTLYHCRAREYDAYHGRFCQRDPELYADGMNLHEYVQSNPLTEVDPTGCLMEEPLWGIMVEGVNAIGAAQTSISVLQQAARVAEGASLQSALLTLVVEAAAAKVGGKALDEGLKLLNSATASMRQSLFAYAGGKLAEQASGIMSNVGKKPIDMGGYIPDVLNKTARFLREIKFKDNGVVLGVTKQLRAFAQWSADNGYKMQIVVREGQKITKNMLQMIEAFGIEVLDSLP